MKGAVVRTRQYEEHQWTRTLHFYLVTSSRVTGFFSLHADQDPPLLLNAVHSLQSWQTVCQSADLVFCVDAGAWMCVAYVPFDAPHLSSQEITVKADFIQRFLQLN